VADSERRGLGDEARSLIADPRCLVDGKWVHGEAADAVTVVDPASEQVLARFPAASVAQAHTAVAGARRLVDGGAWAAVSPADRSRLLHRAVAALDRRRDALVEIIVAETGSPISLTRGLQVDAMIEHLAWFADAAARGPLGGAARAVSCLTESLVTSWAAGR